MSTQTRNTSIIERTIDYYVKRVPYETQRTLSKWFFRFLVFVTVLVIGFPTYVMLKASLQPELELFSHTFLFVPHHPTLENFQNLFTQTSFIRFYLNSIIAALGTMILSVVSATLAGYSLTRFSFPGKERMAQSVLFSYMFPPLLIGLPMFMIWRNLSLLNSYPGIILAHTAHALPFDIWLMWKFFQTVPISYEESAWVYGAGRLRAMRDVAIPMALPGIISVAIFSFAISWSDFTFANLLLTQEPMKTLPIGMLGFIEQQAVHWGLIMSAAVMMALPAFLLVYFLQSYLLRGFSVGGLG
ncbi:carbohydrate ABC transporter permease [Halomicrococcus sp. NG-SE-24]|uniref:carbohydrate ABC transporter permease n=1 Tax=Halomicrococcus sp. NG-SE-24 TaxID=3436928 RepID=UPI003D9538A8